VRLLASREVTRFCNKRRADRQSCGIPYRSETADYLFEPRAVQLAILTDLYAARPNNGIRDGHRVWRFGEATFDGAVIALRILQLKRVLADAASIEQQHHQTPHQHSDYHARHRER
jgi:hypothetical protein